jgi:hypothetical protein
MWSDEEGDAFPDSEPLGEPEPKETVVRNSLLPWDLLMTPLESARDDLGGLEEERGEGAS